MVIGTTLYMFLNYGTISCNLQCIFLKIFLETTLGNALVISVNRSEIKSALSAALSYEFGSALSSVCRVLR